MCVFFFSPIQRVKMNKERGIKTALHTWPIPAAFSTTPCKSKTNAFNLSNRKKGKKWRKWFEFTLLTDIVSSVTSFRINSIKSDQDQNFRVQNLTFCSNSRLILGLIHSISGISAGFSFGIVNLFFGIVEKC